MGQLPLGNSSLFSIRMEKKCRLTRQDVFVYSNYKKSSRYRPKVAQRVSTGIAVLFLDLGVRRGWVVSTTPRPLYPRERPGIHCTGGCTVTIQSFISAGIWRLSIRVKRKV
jgi:hypothetical protein